MDATFISQNAKQALIYSIAVFMACLMLFMIAEPTVGRGATASSTDTFTIRQQITDEISFLVPAADVTMIGALNGLTGGQASGTTYFVVRSNSNSGYTVDVAFSNSPAMRGESTNSTALRNYGSSTEPTYTFFSSTSAQFGFTVSASTTLDLDPSFLDNGSTLCNQPGGSDTGGAASCWMGATSTSNYRIINRSTSAGTGATTSMTFRVQVPSSPSPALDEDFYTATATLTAVNQ
jgi:hypothetical protein